MQMLKLTVKGVAYRNLHFFTPLKSVKLPKALLITHVDFQPATTSTPSSNASSANSSAPTSAPTTPQATHVSLAIPLSNLPPNSPRSLHLAAVGTTSQPAAISPRGTLHATTTGTLHHGAPQPAPVSPRTLHPTPVSPRSSSLAPRLEVTIRSNRVAPYVYLNSGKYRGKFSDNGFLLLPGEERKGTSSNFLLHILMAIS